MAYTKKTNTEEKTVKTTTEKTTSKTVGGRNSWWKIRTTSGWTAPF